MNPIEVASGYDQLAEQWNSENFPRANGVKQHERALAFAEDFPETTRSALDIGCGSSGRLIDLLMSRGLAVEGLGIPRMLELLVECACICRHLEHDQYPESHVYVITQKALE